MSCLRRRGFSAAELHLPVFVDVNVAPATATHTYDVLNLGRLGDEQSLRFRGTRSGSIRKRA